MKWSLTLTALLAAMAVTLPVLPGAANDKGEPDPVRIGMVQTLFADVPTPLVNLVTPTFKSLMKDFTGLNGDPNAVVQSINNTGADGVVTVAETGGQTTTITLVGTHIQSTDIFFGSA